MLHALLWQSNADLVARILDHPFVQGLDDGTLDRESFRRYVAQDAFFLRAFLKAYAVAAAKCDDFDQARVFHDLMGGVFDEIQLHQNYAATLDIDLSNVRPYAATSAYTDFLQRVAWHESLAEIIAAMVPCMRLYQYLGSELAASLRTDHPYKDWITTYAGEEFAQLCTRLESLLDELATDVPTVHEAYRCAMQCEFDFFSAPLEKDS
ncbi:Thiaminase-2 [Rubripirellula obstinata]|uniref:Thiaminase-2 n=1 Tax=Rubripirellula obstinata TaxID=406547 RepID=A0A5B1CFL4_9BACT|nr:TenA family protein [Rubripirellula obstinata]KAA1258705.1 Thiaminase-2 [Rubripirellula obstinata]